MFDNYIVMALFFVGCAFTEDKKENSNENIGSC